MDMYEGFNSCVSSADSDTYSHDYDLWVGTGSSVYTLPDSKSSIDGISSLPSKLWP